MRLMVRVLVLTIAANFLTTPSQAHPLLDAPVAITGIFAAGETVQVTYTGSRNSLQSVNWYADNELIETTANSLTLTASEVGKEISARVFFTKNRMRKQIWINSEITVYASAPTNKGSMSWGDETLATPGCFRPRPNNSSEVRVGWTVYMSCQPHNTSYGSPVSSSYTWYVNNQITPTQTKSLYRLQPSDVGKTISALYIATWDNGAKLVQLKKMNTTPLASAALSNVSIAGSVASGQLRAIADGVETGATLEYFWYRNYQLLPTDNSATLITTFADAGAIFHVLVRVTASNRTAAALLSKPVIGNSYVPIEVADRYAYTPDTQLNLNELDIVFSASPSIDSNRLVVEKNLILKAVNYWDESYLPADLKIVYMDISDVAWMEEFLAARPTWANRVPGGIRDWVNRHGCGFAMTFKTDTELVILQCLPDIAHPLDQQVGPHEYAHAVQFSQSMTTNLYVTGVPWMIEGFANYFGLVNGLGGPSPVMSSINLSLAQQASQFDASLLQPFGTFTNLKWFQAGSLPDVEIMFNRNGNVWDWYFRGSLIAEWLTMNYSRSELLEWQSYAISAQTLNTEISSENVKTRFAEIFNIQFDDLALHMAPYLALRSTQLLASWRKAPPKIRKSLKVSFVEVSSYCPEYAALAATC